MKESTVIDFPLSVIGTAAALNSAFVKGCKISTFTGTLPASKEGVFVLRAANVVSVAAPVGNGKEVASIVKLPPPSATFKCPEVLVSKNWVTPPAVTPAITKALPVGVPPSVSVPIIGKGFPTSFETSTLVPTFTFPVMVIVSLPKETGNGFEVLTLLPLCVN